MIQQGSHKILRLLERSSKWGLVLILGLFQLSAMYGTDSAAEMHVREALMAPPSGTAPPTPLMFSDEGRHLEDPTGADPATAAIPAPPPGIKSARLSTLPKDSPDMDVRFGGSAPDVDSGCRGISMDISPGGYCDAEAPQCGDGIKVPGRWTKGCECRAENKACPPAEELARMGVGPKSRRR